MRIRSSLLPILFTTVFSLAVVHAQDVPKPDDKTPVKVNYLNVCSPSDTEKDEINTALDRIPKQAKFAQDFEVTRGRSSMQAADPARYIRLRRELNGDPIFSNVQYSLSTDAKDTVETLVLKVKDPKELFSVALEDQVSAASSSPASVLDVNTPVSRIKLERFGKANVVLSRCPGGDQSVYEPLFAKASTILAGYRRSLGLHTMFRMDIQWLASAKAPTKPKTAGPEPLKPKAETAKPKK